jgi:hypothetical protein
MNFFIELQPFVVFVLPISHPSKVGGVHSSRCLKGGVTINLLPRSLEQAPVVVKRKLFMVVAQLPTGMYF